MRTWENSTVARSHVLSRRTEDFFFSRGVYLDEWTIDVRRKEFFTPLFLTQLKLFLVAKKARTGKPDAHVWPRAGHGWVILISGLHTPLARLDDYFGSDAEQYLDNTLTAGFVRSPSTTPSLYILYASQPSCPSAEHHWTLTKDDFCCYHYPL